MAVDLKIDEGAFENAIKNFETRKMSMQVAYLSIYTDIHELEGVWKGANSDAFRSKFGELFNNIKQIEQVMDNIVSMLRSILSTVGSTESGLTSSFSNVDAFKGYL